MADKDDFDPQDWKTKPKESPLEMRLLQRKSLQDGELELSDTLCVDGFLLWDEYDEKWMNGKLEIWYDAMEGYCRAFGGDADIGLKYGLLAEEHGKWVQQEYSKWGQHILLPDGWGGGDAFEGSMSAEDGKKAVAATIEEVVKRKLSPSEKEIVGEFIKASIKNEGMIRAMLRVEQAIKFGMSPEEIAELARELVVKKVHET